MKAIQVNKEKVFAKLIALSAIYAKEESNRIGFLQRISYTPNEMTAVIKRIDDADFRSWVVASMPLMQCRQVA